MTRSPIPHLLAAVLVALCPGIAAAQQPIEDQALGKRFYITAESLPAPGQGAGSNGSQIVPRRGAMPNVPEGFGIQLFAEGLTHPRSMLALPDGGIVLAQQSAGTLTYLKDSDGDGAADIAKNWARGLQQPYGLALATTGEHAGDLLVADINAVWRVPYEGGDSLTGDGVAVTETGVFGSGRGHSTRSLLVDPATGAMYVGVGSMANIGEEPVVKASIQRFDADGSNQTTYASGLRNPTGMAWNPLTGLLWTMVQERDGMGNELVPDYLTGVNEGDFFGWPYAYTGGLPQPGFADRAPPGLLDDVEMPDVLFEAHSSAMDVAFIPASWPEEYRGDAIAALKGSWNRQDPTGNKLVRVFFDENGEATGEYENFANGFWVSGNGPANVWGRPASLEFLADGSLLVADDTGGTIWRIWAQ